MMGNNVDASPPRNNKLFDRWSLVHVATSIILAMILHPLVALLIVWLWEPFELFILSPLLGKFGIVFGHETLRNVISDLIFDLIGVLAGWLIITLS